MILEKQFGRGNRIGFRSNALPPIVSRCLDLNRSQHLHIQTILSLLRLGLALEGIAMRGYVVGIAPDGDADVGLVGEQTAGRV